MGRSDERETLRERGHFCLLPFFYLVKTKVDREGNLFLNRGKATTLWGLLRPFPLIPAANLLNKVSHWCIFFTNVSGHHKKFVTEAAARDELLTALFPPTTPTLLIPCRQKQQKEVLKKDF